MLSMTEARPAVGAKYVKALRSEFAGAVQEESWQAPDQVTLTVERNSLPDIVERIY